jgi:GT2 family glycosyltransferase
MSGDSKDLYRKGLNSGSGAITGGNTKENIPMVKTAIVILNWNGIGYLKMFLDKVTLLSSDDETVVYVADNGSTDGSPEWIASNSDSVKLIRFEKNFGFAGGYNLALDQIDAKYFVIINSDIEVTEGWLKPLVDFMDNNPAVASCQPKILSFSQKGFFEYAGAAGGYLDKFGYPFCRGRIFNNVEKDNGQYDSQTDIFWSTGACMVVRSDAWRKCGGFDADFFAHMEEIDLCWRFQKSGYRVSYVPGSVVYHVGALPYNSPFKTYLNFRNSLYLLYKNLPEANFKRILFCRKMLDGLAALVFLAKGRFKSVRSVWKAHMDYYRNSGALKEKRTLLLLRNTKNDKTPNMLLNKSIVFEFYLKGHKTFNSIFRNSKH